jgi:hypothetical protein
VALALVVVGLVVLAQNSRVLVPNIDSYRVTVQRAIVVQVAVAPCSWTRVTGVAETLTEVRVTVETLPCPIPLPATDELAARDLTIVLADDLGARVVRDAEGQAIPLRSSAGPPRWRSATPT